MISLGLIIINININILFIVFSWYTLISLMSSFFYSDASTHVKTNCLMILEISWVFWDCVELFILKNKAFTFIPKYYLYFLMVFCWIYTWYIQYNSTTNFGFLTFCVCLCSSLNQLLTFQLVVVMRLLVCF